jgi:butyrate kinase
MNTESILAINPGSTSTKIAWFRGEEELWRENLSHPVEELASYPSVADQFPFRLGEVERVVRERGYSLDDLHCVVGRGGILDPLESGTYAVGDLLLEHLRRGKPWEHASNLGGILAHSLGEPRKIPFFIVDPVAVDEMDSVARITGMPELPKRSLAHALNIKTTVRRAAKDLEKPMEECNFVVVHLGGGISVCAHRKGRMCDVNNANELGPFSPERAGGVPSGGLVERCFQEGATLGEIRKSLVSQGGLVGYLGTSDVREVKQRIARGDAKALEVYQAMIWQVAKDIGAYAVPLEGEIDAILLTGGIAHDEEFCQGIIEKVQWIAPVLRYPGEDEMRALAEGALRVLRGEEKAKQYQDHIVRGE